MCSIIVFPGWAGAIRTKSGAATELIGIDILPTLKDGDSYEGG
jgi:hypothetical protein